MGAPKKLKKPPIQRKSVLARLERARDEQLFVGVRRWIPGSDRIDGFVLALGDEWVVLAKLDGVRLDGWCLLRLKDIQAVFVDPDSFQVKALRARDHWPPPAVDVELDDVVLALTSAARVAPVTSIFVEFDRPGILWAGSVRTIDEDRLHLLEVDARAEWQSRPRAIDLEDVTRIEVGGCYEDALALVAGPPPTARATS